MKKHEVKIKPKWFQDVIDNKKSFELRFNDRDYKEGDELYLREWDDCYTTRKATFRIKYILENVDGLETGYCLLGLEPLL